MSWTTPKFCEIKMDAEIGSYQDDFDRPGEGPLFVAERAAQPSADEASSIE